jgi:hypothetical protein
MRLLIALTTAALAGPRRQCPRLPTVAHFCSSLHAGAPFGPRLHGSARGCSRVPAATRRCDIPPTIAQACTPVHTPAHRPIRAWLFGHTAHRPSRARGLEPRAEPPRPRGRQARAIFGYGAVRRAVGRSRGLTRRRCGVRARGLEAGRVDGPTCGRSSSRPAAVRARGLEAGRGRCACSDLSSRDTKTEHGRGEPAPRLPAVAHRGARRHRGTASALYVAMATTTRHSGDCRMAFGRLDPAHCDRCLELANGARPREWASTRRNRDDARRLAEIRAHKCTSAGCGPVCTFGDW